MSEADRKIAFDLDRILSNPKFKDDPQIKKAKRIHKAWSTLRDVYTSIGLAIYMEDLEVAEICINEVQTCIRSASTDMNLLKDVLAQKRKEKEENEKTSRRSQETMKWIEEAENGQ